MGALREGREGDHLEPPRAALSSLVWPLGACKGMIQSHPRAANRAAPASKRRSTIAGHAGGATA